MEQHKQLLDHHDLTTGRKQTATALTRPRHMANTCWQYVPKKKKKEREKEKKELFQKSVIYSDTVAFIKLHVDLSLKTIAVTRKHTHTHRARIV